MPSRPAPEIEDVRAIGQPMPREQGVDESGGLLLVAMCVKRVVML